MNFDLLRSARLYLVDTTVKPQDKRIEAGWVYAEPGLAPIEVVKSQSGESFSVCIPEQMRLIQQPSQYFFANENVDFLTP